MVRSIAHVNSQGLAQHAQDLDKTKPAENLHGRGREPQRLTPSRGPIGNLWLLGEGDSIFFRHGAPGRLSTFP